MIEKLPAWLYADVPLWAFLAALLTSPAKWSRTVTAWIERRLNDSQTDSETNT